MKDIKQEVEKFMQDFESAPKTETLRHAINLALKQEGLIDFDNIKTAEKLLNEWFKRKLYSLGRIIKKLTTLSQSGDYNNQIGIGYSVEAKKDKINIGRYLMHLLLMIESKDRQIQYLQSEVLANRQNYLDMEETIKEAINAKDTPQEIRMKFDKFYWLNEDEE